MRAIGYSLESAIADLVDNSISATAKTLTLRYSPYAGEPYVALLDDGTGMTSQELTAAMRHGSQNPDVKRDTGDLGRFGLGMKTASLSQCTQLTVITAKAGRISAARWDLDVIAETERWTLLLLDSHELAELPLVDQLRNQRSGTLVVWKNLDRLSAGEASVEAGLSEGMIRVRNHLALVFHRFLDDAGPARIQIKMNADPVPARDPFLMAHRSTQRLPAENIEIAGSIVRAQAFILPHYSRLKPEELELAGGEEGLRRQQGFYVYRNRRLIIWGTWFRLARQEELTKLARVQVDMTNDLDHLWVLDVMKSEVHPPVEVRQNLRRIIERIGEGSRRVYTFRGRRTNTGTRVHLWDRIEAREGVSYRINRAHPLIIALGQNLDDDDLPLLESVMQEAEDMLPVESLYADMASDKTQVHQTRELTFEQLSDLAGQLLDAAGPEQELRANLLNNLATLEPFFLYPDETLSIVNRLRDES